MRASVYARISRDREGAGLGVATQEADCRELADRLGASIVSVHTDNDLSAYSGKPRPGYRDLLREVQDGEVDVVLAWHTDRLHRSPAELEEYITACEQRAVSTHTVKAGPVDLSTSSGRMVARTLGNHARYEVEHAVERMQRAKQRSAEAGVWKGGRRPFGYEADGVTVREDEAAALRSACDQVLAGESLRSIARAWNAAGLTTTTGKPWGLSAPRRALLRPRNAGLMEHRGEIVGDAQWPAIVDREKWEAVRRILLDPARRTNPETNAPKHLGSGLYRCGLCHGPMRAGHDRYGRPLYRCAERGGEAGHASRDMEQLDAYVSAVLVERLRRDDLADLLSAPAADVDLEGLQARAIELDERKTQLAALFADGDVDARQLAEGSRRLTTELDGVREQIAVAYNGTALADIGGAPDPGQAWLESTLERRRLVLGALMTVIVQQSGRGRPPGWKPGESYFRPDTVAIEWVA
ncbi:recombinase family protein [uncultured Nocardioides sp.]|uniref:recombinase family protein n=1 Tax=uncultured Nocardioides sp. TaxID=198441 RepID=UPI00262609A3|nr:recombinase family protein [uncultured Nocardioides sp.]